MMLSLLAKRQPCSVIRRLPLFAARLFASNPKTRIPDHKTLKEILAHHLRYSIDPKTSSNFMMNYLISSFGFHPYTAARLSKPIAFQEDPELPDSVRHFFKHNGFTDDEIITIICERPEILCCRPDLHLEPHLRALRETGLSNSSVIKVVLSDPTALYYWFAAPRIESLKKFFLDDGFLLHDGEAALMRVYCAGSHIDSKLDLLTFPRFELSNDEIQRIILTFPGFIHNSRAFIKDRLYHAMELGFPPGSPMFLSVLRAISSNSRLGMQKQMERFKSYGWSNYDFFSAFRKFPSIANLTENNLRMKMDFLIAQVGCAPSYIAAYPGILSYSLAKRMRPRQNVLHLLESKGLSSKAHNFCRAIKMTDSKFVETYIWPHREEIAGLHEAYLAACA